MSERLFFLAGEPSGDTRAAGLCRAIQEQDDQVQMRGVGGAKMQEAGVDLVMNMAREGVVGLWEVLGKLAYFAGAYRRVLSEIRQFDPDAVVLVDFPGFNLKLAEQLKRESIPVVYYISPQVWAWRKYRIHKIRRCVDLMLVLFQFEEELYERHNVPVRWVGHPLVDEMSSFLEHDDEEVLFPSIDRSRDGTVIGLLPGSRVSEFSRLYPRMIDAVHHVADRVRVQKTLVPVAEELNMDEMSEYRNRRDEVNEEWVSGRSREVMRASDILLTASGTTTLEAALIGTPMVVCYRVNPLTWVIGKLLVETEYISLVNLVAQEEVVPECIQWEATAERLSDELQLLLGETAYKQCTQKLQDVRRRLGPPGASKRAAESVLNFAQTS